MTGSLPRPGRTGVRISGDHYQWLHAWEGCVGTLLAAGAAGLDDQGVVVAIGVEVDDAGDVDDVVLYRPTPPHKFAQVKYAVDSSAPLSLDFLAAPSGRSGASLLSKLVASWRSLSADNSPVDMALVTNRLPDPNDLLLRDIDGRTGLLLPRAGEGGPRSDRARARVAWASAAGLGSDELRGCLSAVRFELGRTPAMVGDKIKLLMALAGLRSDPAAVVTGADWVAAQVRNGHQLITAEMVRAGVAQLDLVAEPAWVPVSVATLLPDPLAASAANVVDWVDRFDGHDAYTKRRPAPPASWQELQRDLEGLAPTLAGVPRIAFTGSMRQATAFTAGAALRMVTGADVAVLQRGALWTSTASYAHPAAVQVEVRPMGTGSEVAIAIEVATAISDDVQSYLRDSELPVGALHILRPHAGPSDRAVNDSSHANALAVGLRDASRRAGRNAPRVRLFLAGPMGLALLLGHRWNRVAPTVVYEDVGPAGYEAAFTVSA